MPTPTSAEQMTRLVTGYWISQALYVAAKTGVADLLGGGPRTAEDLADAAGLHAPSLHRLLRALASCGVFSEGTDGRFSLTPLAECLLTGRPGSQRDLAVMMGEERYRAWGELLSSVRTGTPAFERLYGMPVFEYLARHPEQGKVFDAGMTGVHGRETAAMLQAYNFAGIELLTDVGGGNGNSLLGVLREYPAMRGILFDRPEVVERAKAGIEAEGLVGRCQVVGGDFFESVPPGADAYLMRHILHDWDDARASRILLSVHRALTPRGKVLLVEGIIPAGNSASFTKLLDLNMLVVLGGKERTEEEYRTLLEDAGFHLSKIVPTAAEVSVIEAVKAG